MSLRSLSPTLSNGEVLSGDEEKAISTHEHRDRDSKVNSSTRHLQNGSSSRASRQTYLGGLSKDLSYHFRDAKDLKPRERSRSPYRNDRSRSRSPYRANKTSGGEKRQHDDDHYSAKGGSDPRRFKVHYEDRPGSRGGIGSRA
ncbi:U4/U6 small nuclear ribonucleoprotein prp4 [Elasticomyces elasticus]|nr:U4/U6 small nuclear ribonucleoprotein prp4 [Elasticomyces elasticus]KAK4985520.1 U4/U6 small nuclear ribonucleoprotein prp4 [Elasticomyces elasticus]